MTKQEKIKRVYESLGFEWEVCSKYITENGVIILPTPDLKYTLKGYDNLIKDTDKFSAFGNEGLKIQPSILSGIYNNNGWICIKDELPEIGDRIISRRDLFEKIVEEIETVTSDFLIWYDMNNITHWKHYESKPPIY